MKPFEAFLYGILTSPSKKVLVVALTLLAFVFSLLMFPLGLVKAKMLPGKSSDTFSVYIDLPKGSSHFQTTHVAQCVIDLLNKEPHVSLISTYIGTGSPLDYAGLVKGSSLKMGEHVAELVVNLTPKESRKERSYAMVHRLRPLLQSTCEAAVEGTSIKLVEEPAGPPTLAAIVVELYGEDEGELAFLNTHVQEVLRHTSGLVDVDTLEEAPHPTHTLVVDTLRATAAGVSLKHLHDTLYLAFEGMIVGVQNSQERFEQIPLFLRLQERDKNPSQNTPAHLERLLAPLFMPNQRGEMVPMVELVQIVPTASKPAIFSKNLERVHTVVAETDLVSQVYPLLEARSTLMDSLSQRYEVHKEGLFNLRLIHKETRASFRLVWDGEMKVTLDTFRDLGGAFIAALVVIFLLMVVYYKSFALSGIILLGSFLSIIGVIVGHWVMDLFTDTTFFLTATSMIGFIALMGINSRNSLLIIDFAKGMMEEGMGKRHAIAHSAATRAKPIFLTVITVVLASAMLALDPIFGGLGVALIFGSLASVVVSLLFVPVLLDKSCAF